MEIKRGHYPFDMKGIGCAFEIPSTRTVCDLEPGNSRRLGRKTRRELARSGRAVCFSNSTLEIAGLISSRPCGLKTPTFVSVEDFLARSLAPRTDPFHHENSPESL